MHTQFADWIDDGTLYVARLDGEIAGTIVVTERGSEIRGPHVG